MRVAVIDYTLCKPTKCNLECIRFCPVNRSAGTSKAIDMNSDLGKPEIFEETCIGCNICVKKCPFNAISIENVPDELEKNTVHRYGINGFKLFGLPVPKQGQITGIIGKNGTGKTTSLRILAGELLPNLGDPTEKPSVDKIIKKFRGTELQAYFEKLSEKKIRVAHKIQYIDVLPRVLKGTVKTLLEKADERGISRELMEQTGLERIKDRKITHLSGGELQKLLIVAVLTKDVDMYIFDEPSSYLDVSERMRMAQIIRDYIPKNAFGLVVEHDLAVLDYLSDNINILYGEPGVYGIVSKPYGTRTGINNFLEGYLPAENMRIRREPIRFHVTEQPSEKNSGGDIYISWSNFHVSLDGFELHVDEGDVKKGEVIGIVGPNGIGKTTFVKTIAGEIKKGLQGDVSHISALRISYKPQYVSHDMFEGKVYDVLREVSPYSFSSGHPIYEEIVRPFGLYKLREREVKGLSGGELQKLAIARALAMDADLYLLDEPSAYLDVEERLSVAKIIKRITESKGIAAFVVEHDMSIIDYIANRIMVFHGEPGKKGHATSPMGLRRGMNAFLKNIEVTFRRDPQTGRPRINKKDSYLDRYQKRIGEYYYVPKEEEK